MSFCLPQGVSGVKFLVVPGVIHHELAGPELLAMLVGQTVHHVRVRTWRAPKPNDDVRDSTEQGGQGRQDETLMKPLVTRIFTYCLIASPLRKLFWGENESKKSRQCCKKKHRSIRLQHESDVHL